MVCFSNCSLIYLILIFILSLTTSTVHGVSVVVNYDLPRDPATYLHRIGRAGRFGRKGLAINLVADRDIAQLRQIEQYYDTIVDELPRNFSQLVV